MGADKATIEIDGVFMAKRVADALRAAGAASVVAIGGDATLLGASGLEVHPDRAPGEGPLGAVAHALDLPGAPVVAVLACDLVAPDPDLIARLVERRSATDADVVVPVAGGRPQWVHAVWHRRVAGVLADVFACGERSLVGASAGLRVEHLEVPDHATRDADRPEDLPAPISRSTA
jgi:molybdopterin-guanine dinucleotide biosynthesis protein A